MPATPIMRLMAREEEIRPAKPPPPGVTSNFVDPVSRADIHAWVSIISPIVAGIFFLLRMYTRIFITRVLGWDDYTCVVAMGLAIADGVTEYQLSRYGTGLHVWDVPYDTYHPNFPRYRLITFSIYMFFMYFVKISILFLYLRVFTTAKSFRIMTWVMMFVVTAYSLAGFVGTISRCNPSKGACDNVTQLSIFSSVLNIVTDIIILVLPLRQVWKLQANTKQKTVLMVVFATGSFVCIVSVVRLAIYIKTLHSTDDTWFVLDGSIWTVIEANVGLICACMPALKALLHHCAPRFFSQISGYPSRGRSDRSDLPNSINDKPYHRYDEDSVELHQKQPRPMEVEVTTES
ncbi:MAG: hypothetical protein M1815_004907 [Lichina confinis]|nr:MAG: hypothetical protein M1815_004907 [Lichina confinis]